MAEDRINEGRIVALVATMIAALALLASAFQAYISWQSLEQYRESFLFSKRAEVCVDFLRDVADVSDQLSYAAVTVERSGVNSDRFSTVMNRLQQRQAGLRGHMSFVILGTAELATDADNLEHALSEAVTVASQDGVTRPQIEEAAARIAAPRATLQTACMSLARGQQ